VRLLRLAILAFMGLSLLALLLAAGALAWQVAIQDRVVPGVAVAGLDLGGLMPAEAPAALSAHHADLQATQFSFRDAQRACPRTPRQPGLSVPV